MSKITNILKSYQNSRAVALSPEEREIIDQMSVVDVKILILETYSEALQESKTQTDFSIAFRKKVEEL